MSWNKNTRHESNLLGIRQTLQSLNVPFTWQIVGTVAGRGNNDEGGHDLYRLTYHNAAGVPITLQEQMQRTHDCDSDDTIVSIDLSHLSQVELSYGARAIPLEITWHEEGYCREYDHTHCPNQWPGQG